MSKLIKDVCEADFEAEVLKSDLPVVVDFWALWCGPCRASTPHFEALAVQYAGQAKFVKVCFDDAGKLVKQYNIFGIPAFLFFKGGEVVARSECFGSPSVGIWETLLKQILTKD